MESDSWAPIFAQHSADPKGIFLPPSFLLFSSLYPSPSFNFFSFSQDKHESSVGDNGGQSAIC